MKCSLCEREYDGPGNNAEPLNSGRCCDFCNVAVTYVRIRRSGGSVTFGALLELEAMARQMKFDAIRLGEHPMYPGYVKPEDKG